MLMLDNRRERNTLTGSKCQNSGRRARRWSDADWLLPSAWFDRSAPGGVLNSFFMSIAVWISTTPLDFPKNLVFPRSIDSRRSSSVMLIVANSSSLEWRSSSPFGVLLSALAAALWGCSEPIVPSLLPFIRSLYQLSLSNAPPSSCEKSASGHN